MTAESHPNNRRQLFVRVAILRLCRLEGLFLSIPKKLELSTSIPAAPLLFNGNALKFVHVIRSLLPNTDGDLSVKSAKPSKR